MGCMSVSCLFHPLKGLIHRLPKLANSKVGPIFNLSHPFLHFLSNRTYLYTTGWGDLFHICLDLLSSFRKLKEENKSQVTEWRQENKKGMEKIPPTSRIEIGPIREEMKEWVRKIEDGTQFALSQFRQAMDSSLQRMKETGDAHATHSREGMDRFQDQMKKIEENMAPLEEKIRG